MTKTFPIADKPLPKNLPANFAPVRWDDYGSSIIGTSHGRRIKFWPADSLIQSMP